MSRVVSSFGLAVALLACAGSSPVDDGNRNDTDKGGGGGVLVSGGGAGGADSPPDGAGGEAMSAAAGAGGNVGAGGATAGAGGAAMAGAGGAPPAKDCPAPTVDPAVNPTQTTSNAGAVTGVAAGNYNLTIAENRQPSATGGMANDGGYWRIKEPGAFLEYSVRTTAAAAHAFFLGYHADAAGGAGEVFIDGESRGVIRFVASDDVGPSGGLPCMGAPCARSVAVAANLDPGVHTYRIVFVPGLPAVDVGGLQLTSASHALTSPGKVHGVATDGMTMMPPEEAAGFFRLNFAPERHAWPGKFSYCMIAYRSAVPRAGRYRLRTRYDKNDAGCAGIAYRPN